MRPNGPAPAVRGRIGVMALLALLMLCSAAPVAALTCGVPAKSGDGVRLFRGEGRQWPGAEGYVLGTAETVTPDGLGSGGSIIQFDIAASTVPGLDEGVTFHDWASSSTPVGFAEGHTYFVTLFHRDGWFTQDCSYTYEVDPQEFRTTLAVARSPDLPATDAVDGERPVDRSWILMALSSAGLLCLLLSLRFMRSAPGGRVGS